MQHRFYQIEKHECHKITADRYLLQVHTCSTPPQVYETVVEIQNSSWPFANFRRKYGRGENLPILDNVLAVQRQFIKCHVSKFSRMQKHDCS